MANGEKLDLYGEYTAEPFEFRGDAKGYSIAAAVAAWLISVVVVNKAILKGATDGISVIINLAISTAVAFAVLGAGYLIAKHRYGKRIERERAEFERIKAEAVPYTVCEYCGGRLEHKYYDAGKPLMPGPNPTRLGIETFTCDSCRYTVKGHSCTEFFSGGTYRTEYTLVFPETYETSRVTEEQLNSGRLVAFIKKQKRVGILKKD